jgi:hypothetical protein
MSLRNFAQYLGNLGIIVLTDSGTGADALLVGKHILLVDSGAGLDTLLIGKNIKLTDLGNGVDLLTVTGPLGGAADMYIIKRRR